MKSRNVTALKMVAIALAALTYAGAVVYGDIQFLQVMDKAFPSDGLMRALAMAGAVMTAVSALTLPIALHWWFAPGLQFLWGIAFWVLDIAALGLNAILAYQVAGGHVADGLGVWQTLSPATPLLAVIGWGIAFLLDPSQKERHAVAEMQADQIDTYATQMRQAAKSEEVYQEILTAAKMHAREFAQSLHGQHVAPSNGTSGASSGTSADTGTFSMNETTDAVPAHTAKRAPKAQVASDREPVAVKPSRNGHDASPLA